MTGTIRELTEQERQQNAEWLIDRFEQRFEPAYRQLARYAALPLVLTPELVSYLRDRFLAKSLPWVAAADLLLSDLCRPVGYEQYAMAPAVRSLLITELEVNHPEQVERIARILLRYIRHLRETQRYFFTPQDEQNQQWAAMCFIAAEQGTVANQVEAAFAAAIAGIEGDGSGVAARVRSELARLVAIMQELKPRLEAYPNLIQLAERVTIALEDERSANSQRLVQLIRGEGGGIGIEPGDEVGLLLITLKAQIMPVLKRLKRNLSKFAPDARLGSLQTNLQGDGTSQNPYQVYVQPQLTPLLEDPQVYQRLSRGYEYGYIYLEDIYPEIESLLDEDLSIAAALNRIERLLDRLNNLVGLMREVRRLRGEAFETDEAGRRLIEMEVMPVLEQLQQELAAFAPEGRLDSVQVNRNSEGLSQNPYLIYVQRQLTSLLTQPQVCLQLPDDLYQAIEVLLYEDLSIEDALNHIDVLLNRLVRLIQTGEGDTDGADRALEIPGYPPLQAFEFEMATIADAVEPEPPEDVATVPELAGLQPQLFEFQVATIAVGEAGTLGQQEIIIHKRPASAWQVVEPLGDGLGLEMVNIPGGEFMMGSPPDELDNSSDEQPQHLVTVPEFWMGKYPVTQAQWRFVAGLRQVNRELAPDPANFKGDDRPVEQVSWWEAVEFCDRLSAYTGRTYRLPSEAEWEYACRAGTTGPFHFGATIDAEVANYKAQDGKIDDITLPGKYGRGRLGEYRQETTIVGSFKVANAFGLYDMHGNVGEWCLDGSYNFLGVSSNYENAPDDGAAWLGTARLNDKDLERVLRGRSWDAEPAACRSASRFAMPPRFRSHSIGFRVVSFPQDLS